MKIVTSSFIIGLSIICASIVNSGAFKQDSKNIITTMDGHVALGDIYMEKRLVDVEVNLDNDDNVFHVRDVSVSDLSKVIDEKFDILLKTYNKNKKEDEKLSKDSVSFKFDLKVRLKSHVRYTSKNIPSFDLVLDDKEFDIKKDSPSYSAVNKIISDFLVEQIPKYESSMLIK
ncbi:hypothetical protein [Pectobacterium versatile]|uniref:hypothetical protein n=1 Tax=Pectobacterium versatile TaxID=2488639 RepID=UPI001CF5567B|nr:hypothetical protein [Pectobacterium versatile]MCA6925363.1 hypothetical protein [Pectobacterium versatile]MCH5082121.1 hypothetical protein [Pectobacterium versatile]MCO4312518.1 hypothetical protein [Pectobacterium versatile]